MKTVRIFVLVVSAILLASCNLRQRQERGNAPSGKTPAPGAVATEPASVPTGCNAPIPVTDPWKITGRQDLELTRNGLTRKYVLYVPTYYKGEPMPVVFALHGGGQFATMHFERLHFAKAAERDGYIVIAPDGQQDPANPNPEDLQWDGGINVPFIGLLIDSIGSHYNIDTRRIYLTGFSAGARLSYRVAADAGMSCRIAAIATAAGEIASRAEESDPWTAVDPSVSGEPMSAIMVQGRLDPKLPIDGGFSPKKNELIISFQGKLEFWVNFISGVPVDFNLPVPATVTASAWKNNETGNMVVGLVDDNLDHDWPTDWDYLAMVWQFFNQVPTR